ncbi:alpha/beta hydrolase [Alteromonas macleodii]|uniref:AB hydrolase-1 domain-containing protein n=1 Tax=Alteromonas macleodii TaxID=28108 RepID=A0A6T9Y4I2_ALTMA|nr:alpha/beta fold hydrolase [Alteromonas macleodii]CAB9495202.1 conserved protein of unknown function [Alteromonas macleodii]
MSSNVQISPFGIAISKLFMKLMFRPMHGWKQAVPKRAEYFLQRGLDGSQLEGSIQTSPSTNVKGVVLLCHPFLKYGMHYFFNSELDKALLDSGFHVVSFNFKGFGCSNIKGHAFSDDVISIAKMIEQRFPGLPIHSLGYSFGGFHLSHALAKNETPFASAVLDSVPGTVTVFFKKGILAKAMKWISSSHLATPTGTSPIIGSLRRVENLPIKFLYGLEDEYILDTDLEELKLNCRNMEFASFPGCGHLDNYKMRKKDYLQELVGFFEANSLTKQN